MATFFKFLVGLFKRIPKLFLGIVFTWIFVLIRLIRQLCARYRYLADLRERHFHTVRCQVIPPQIYKRPDPLIYSQYYLMALGLAVTWDNPDIELRRNGVPVSSSEIEPDSDYEIVARIWNGSTEAPAVGMPVDFSYLDFGIGTARIPIGRKTVDLPVRGAPGHPAFASIIWHTPTASGHYCLLVQLIWTDDANPNNNLGQENILVRPLNSARAQFRFPVRNATDRPRDLVLEADTYGIPPRRPCESESTAKTPEMTGLEKQASLTGALAHNARRNFAIPSTWRVEISPQKLTLSPRQEHVVTINIAAPEEFRGQQVFNLNAFDGNTLYGGVTLYVER